VTRRKSESISYHFTKVSRIPFEPAVEKVIEALKDEGFGILTEIDVKATLKKKLDVDFRNYRILGACNPPFAYQALQAEDKIGTMLPCNVIVQETAEGVVEMPSIPWRPCRPSTIPRWRASASKCARNSESD